MNFDELNLNYNRDGVVLVRNFLPDNDLELVTSAIDFSLKNPSPYSSKITNKKTNSVFFSDYWTYKRNNFIKKILSNNNTINKVKKITGNKEISFFHDHILVKDPSSPSTLWHHDRPYYFIDGANNFSIWINFIIPTLIAPLIVSLKSLWDRYNTHKLEKKILIEKNVL
jgi:ectoine hydroxylase-related dioxygenase (phytanoyl-CoA dioxygenase family)